MNSKMTPFCSCGSGMFTTRPTTAVFKCAPRLELGSWIQLREPPVPLLVRESAGVVAPVYIVPTRGELDIRKHERFATSYKYSSICRCIGVKRQCPHYSTLTAPRCTKLVRRLLVCAAVQHNIYHWHKAKRVDRLHGSVQRNGRCGAKN